MAGLVALGGNAPIDGAEDVVGIGEEIKQCREMRLHVVIHQKALKSHIASITFEGKFLPRVLFFIEPADPWDITGPGKAARQKRHIGRAGGGRKDTGGLGAGSPSPKNFSEMGQFVPIQEVLEHVVPCPIGQ